MSGRGAGGILLAGIGVRLGVAAAISALLWAGFALVAG
jgi:hypothetical protein